MTGTTCYHPCYKDDNRLEALMLKSLLGQAHTLCESLKCRMKLGVIGAKASKDSLEKEVTASRVRHAIGQDLSDFPGFDMWDDELLMPAPETCAWPAPPSPSRYVLKRRI